MTAMAENEIAEGADLRAGLRSEPDPAFLVGLRRESRAAHARRHRNLGWFDLEFELGPLRVVHDGDLVHFVTNDPGHFRDFAGERLGFVPERGEAKVVREHIAGALAGKVEGSRISYLGELPRFHRQVLEATARIPRGEVRPYAWVARLAGNAGAVRAAGTALGHNPVPFIVPCHRVVKSDLDLGQYSAAGGTETKMRVLRLEGVGTERLSELHAQGVRYIGHAGATVCFPGCAGDWEMASAVRPFRTLEEALAAGYTPCSACRPSLNRPPSSA